MARLGMSIGAALAALTLQLPATAQNVLAGSDLWTTPAGGTSNEDFSGTPIPAGFFGPGSDPFTGTVVFQGRPLDAPGTNGNTDTIVARRTDAVLPGCVSGTTVPIEIVALNLVSVQPITVTFNAGLNSATYDVHVCLSGEQPQQQGGMQIVHDHINGGSFSSFLPVTPKFIFTRCTTNTGAALPLAIADPGPQVTLNGNGGWTYNNMGLPIDPSPGGAVDHDCDPGSPANPYPPSSNFHAGVQTPGANCVNPGGPPGKNMTPEMAMLAAHGVLPNNPAPGTPYAFGDGTGTPCPCGNIGQPGHGCDNSFGTGGGLLYGGGKASISNDTLELKAEHLQPTGTLLFVQGNAQLSPPNGNPNGDGVLGVTAMLVRFYPVESAQCGKANRGAPYGDPAISVQGGALAGQTKYYVVYYRNPFAFCTAATWNWSNSYKVTWQP